MRSFFRFFKLPLQIIIGGYAAFIIIAVTVASWQTAVQKAMMIFCPVVT